uniref:Uncharacterized protein n=1 Tax=Anguilla anguilla TaxID=7936 RepID=A0A0E9WEQ4_ANGAN
MGNFFISYFFFLLYFGGKMTENLESRMWLIILCPCLTEISSNCLLSCLVLGLLPLINYSEV